jgi:iron complex outermembrane receptor protein
MKKTILVLLFFTNLLFGNGLDSLLQEYESTVEKSLRTVNEKLGHVVIYSQQELRLMQYNNLGEILKELPLMSLGKTQFGAPAPLLTGSKSVSGFFRFFINDYEISSAYLQSPSLSWGNLPLDFIDHIEIYYGDSSFSVDNTTGIFFIRIYTKSAKKENGTQLNAQISTDNSNSQSLIQSQSLENGWSYLFFVNQTKSKEKFWHNGDNIFNNEERRYLFADISNATTKVNLGYTDVNKDAFMGYSFDANPDDSSIKSKDYFIDITQYFLEDKSLKANLSVGVDKNKYNEKNTQGLGITPLLDLANMGATIPAEFYENTTFTKTNVSLSKTYRYNNHNFLAGLHFFGKKYTLNDRTSLNFMNQANNVGRYNDFNKENVYSILFQDDYRLTEDFTLLANIKLDKYERNGYLKDETEHLFRVGGIYTPNDNLGFKGFYTRTYLPVSFYNIDFVDKNHPNLQSQQYELYTAEIVYAKNKSKINLIYNHVTIDDFIYYIPIGFINVNDSITTQGLSLTFAHEFLPSNSLHFNYFVSKQNQGTSNYQNGEYIKYMGRFGKFEYFTSLIYRKSFSFYDVHVKDSYDLNLGVTYNFTKDFSISLKGQNLLDKSTQSLYAQGFPGAPFALDNNYDPSASLSVRWVF